MAISQQAQGSTTPDTDPRGSGGTDEFRDKVNQLLADLRVESEALGRELTEIDMLLRQSNGEVEKLANRELNITNRVRDMELNLDNYSRTDMKTIYNSAHEIQMRLFMMRAQVEQLEAKRNSMKSLQSRIHRFTSVLIQVPEGYSPGSGYTSAIRSGLSGPLTQRTTDPSLMAVEGMDPQIVLSQVIQAQEDERLYVSRQIHDGPAQTMTNLVLRAEICERLIDMDVARAKTELAGLKNVVNTTLQDTRRFIFDLRPMILDDLGLEPTLRRYILQFTEKFKLDVGAAFNGLNGRLPIQLEVAIFRIVQEALTNVAEHAHANRAQVTVDVNGDVITVLVEDDGSGFSADDARLNDPKYKGIASMRQRVEMFAGALNIDTAPGRGTRVTATLPAETIATL